MAANNTTRYGNGAGWGGPARGSSMAKRHDFEGQRGPGRGRFSHEGEARVERCARHIEGLCEILYDIAHNTNENPSLRIQAADKLLNRLDGLPVAKTEQLGEVKIIVEGGLPKYDDNVGSAS